MLLKEYKTIDKGLFIYVGIDDLKNEIVEIIEPNSKCNKFIYKCMNKFITDHVYDYIKTYDGSIIFVNGNKYYVYIHGNNGFEKMLYKSVDLGTRHNKGGQSQHRHERNYDIIKDYYEKLYLYKYIGVKYKGNNVHDYENDYENEN